MKKGVLDGLGRTASKRVKRLQAAAARAADEILEKTYAGTAEQTLRGAATMTKILHEKDGTIAKAKKPSAKKKSRKPSKRSISKRSASRTIRRKSGRA